MFFRHAPLIAISLLTACQQIEFEADLTPANGELAGEWTPQQDQELSDWINALDESAPPATDAESGPAAAAPAGIDAMPSGVGPGEDVGLAIHLFDIGQADATFVIGPAPDRRTMLIDLGEPTGGRQPSHGLSSAEHVLHRIRELTGGSHVDYFVLTHYHSDHAGIGLGPTQGWGTGIIRLLSDNSIRFSVGEFIHIGDKGSEYMEDEHGRAVYLHIKNRMPYWLDRGWVGRETAPRFGRGQLDLGDGVSVDILSYGGEVRSGASAFDRAANEGVDYERTPGNENDLSIALEISLGDFEFFTAGDLNGTDNPGRRPIYVRRDFGEVYANVEFLLVDDWTTSNRESDVEVYRANHHGSHYSTTQRLLDALDPEWVLFSTGGQYGHPAAGIIRRSAGTARQLATTWVSNFAVFQDAGGERVGEIVVEVATDGSSYVIDGRSQRAFDDMSEASGADEAVGGGS